MRWSDGKPLAGVRVLDFCRVVSGPFATMLLGDLGADVVKIEAPGAGDEARTYGPPFVEGESAYFLSVNRNKRSIVLDLKSEAGRDTARALARESEVVVENFRPGAMERLGLGYEALSTLNPGLVYCAISGFGRAGPDAHRPGYDLILQGEGGLMALTGDPNGPPMKVGTSIADLVTGLYATQAVLAGLAQRDRAGSGGRLDVSMLDSMASILAFNAGIYFATGRNPQRAGNAHPTISPYEAFEAADGWFTLGVANDKFWSAFCEALGVAELKRDPRFASPSKRAAARGALHALLQPRFRQHRRQHWLELFSAVGVPCGAIRSISEVCEASALVDRGQVGEVDHPTAGALRYIASPIRFDDRPQGSVAAPPRLGADAHEILSDWLSYEDAEIAALRAAGAFGKRGAG